MSQSAPIVPGSDASASTSQLPGPFPVGSYAARLRAQLRGFTRVQLTGEVFGVSRSRVRIYFELRDAQGAIQCSMWREDFDALGVPLVFGSAAALVMLRVKRDDLTGINPMAVPSD